MVDLSSDFRLDHPGRYAATHGRPHPAPELLERFVYGLPEWRRDKLKSAKRIANPGCFATAVQLAAAAGGGHAGAGADRGLGGDGLLGLGLAAGRGHPPPHPRA